MKIITDIEPEAILGKPLIEVHILVAIALDALKDHVLGYSERAEALGFKFDKVGIVEELMEFYGIEEQLEKQGVGDMEASLLKIKNQIYILMVYMTDTFKQLGIADDGLIAYIECVDQPTDRTLIMYLGNNYK